MTGTRKIPFWATLLTLCGVVVLCGLGTWQLQRLEWKREILTALGAAEKISAAPTLSYQQILDRTAQPDVELIRYVFLQGKWINKEIAVGPRTWKGETGYHILAPLQLKDGVVLVNRGWVPQDKNDDASRPKTPKQARVMGLLRRPEKPGIFTPENRPEKEEWYYINLQELGEALDTELAPLVLYTHLDTAHPEWPLAEALNRRPENSHLQYAIFWFTMAGGLVVIYFLRFWRKT